MHLRKGMCLVMSKNGIQHSEEFKHQILSYTICQQVQVLDLSREYGTTTVTIYKWVKQLSPVKISENDEISAIDYQVKEMHC